MNAITQQQDLLSYLIKRNFGKEILTAVEEKKHITVKGFAGSTMSLIAAEYYTINKKTILIITTEPEEALYITTELEELVGKDSVLYLPSTNAQPYKAEKTQNANIVLRTEVINQLNISAEPKIIVANNAAINEKVPQKENLNNISQTIKIGDKINFDITEELINKFQFNQTDFVSEPGEFAVRGGIVDIFSYSNEKPYRISLFGNEIENIKTFDIETQLTIEKIESIQLIPNINITIKEKKVPILNILPKDAIIITQNLQNITEEITKFYQKAEEIYNTISQNTDAQVPKEIFITEEEFTTEYQKFKTINFDQTAAQNKNIITLKQTPQPSFNKNFDMLVEDLQNKQKDGYDIWMSYSTEKQKERLEEIINTITATQKIAIYTTPIISELHAGLVDSQNKIAIYTEHQITNRYQKIKTKNSFAKSEQITLKDIMSLKVGDYITHIDHGIGKFLGLVKINNNGKTQECFKLEYKNKDLLYVSIHTLHKISKYNKPEGKEIALSKLGSPAWKTLKSKTKTKLKQIAFNLIQLYAKRKATKGFAFSPDSYLQHELEASFVYQDTPDQEKATIEVKQDMEADTIMDRLICGDVGFGKTEIAIRAAFKAATDGKQVAILVPTTILAIQHYKNFTERLKNFPVNIAYINRFITTKQKNEIIAQIQNGNIDIVIGTHQITSNKIKFKNLGLLIIDEEHKFGVAVKDKIKTIKNNIDTLTLTATPIPRTLQFSIMAARDLSIIKTPPPNRQPINTEIITFDLETIKEAITKEIQRGGQVYFIHNNIQSIKEIEATIQQLVPEARTITGHGQMGGKKLEENIIDFINGKYNVLISTTIIESGVDIPNANTIIINNAHKFGMADLHQMRGRVGRSNKKAYCYLITPPQSSITTEAQKRLQAIEQFSDLGSGFQIAMKDLEIRGAGDLLGGEQSGFINEMGFDAYQKIIQETLEELQEDPSIKQIISSQNIITQNTKQTNIDTDWELIIPDSYITSTEERLNIYQQIAEIKNHQQIKQIKNQLEDRFGKIPQQAKDLLKTIETKWLATEIGIEKITIKNNTLIAQLPRNPQDKFYQTQSFKNIINYINQNPKNTQLKQKTTNTDTLLIIKKTGVENVEQLNDMLNQIINQP